VVVWCGGNEGEFIVNIDKEMDPKENDKGGDGGDSGEWVSEWRKMRIRMGFRI
jgi:hypothetical protein